MNVAMIPARIGSTRLARKNLALINGKPLIAYAVEAAINSQAFDKVVINSDNDIFKKIAERYNIEFYKRPTELGTSAAKVDDVVADFMQKFELDILTWLNPASPLQSSHEVGSAMKNMIENQYDSFVTVLAHKVHSIYKNRPINFSFQEKFEQTQELIPVQTFVYSICAWKKQSFLHEYREKGYAFFCGKTGYFEVSKESGFLVKTEDDLRFVDFFARAREQDDTFTLQYDHCLQET